MATRVETPSASVLRREVSRFIAAARERSEGDGERRRRTQRRYHRSWPLLVRLRGHGPGEDLSAALHNVSELGIAFLSRSPIPASTAVFIKLFWHEPGCPRVPAVVRHCTQVQHGHLVGCEFSLGDEAACNVALSLGAAWYD